MLGCGLTTAGIFLPSFGTNAKRNANKMETRVDVNGSGNPITGGTVEESMAGLEEGFFRMTLRTSLNISCLVGYSLLF